MTVLDPAPVELDAILEPSWLTAALTDVADGASVVEVNPVDNLTTVASKVRFEAVIEGPDGQRTSRHYCVKGNFGVAVPGGRMAAVEARMYRDELPALGLRHAAPAYVGIDEPTGRSIIILEDMIVAGYTLLSALQPYSVDTARGTLDQLAKLHAGTWGDERLASYSWAPPFTANHMPMDVIGGLMEDGRAPDLPAVLRDPEVIVEATQRVLAKAPTCGIHGDAHSGNAFLDPQGNAGWYDWQCFHPGHWATDVSYHLGTSLTTGLRRDHEQELVRGYLESLAGYGQEPPSWEEAWDAYRTHLAYGYYMWAITRFHNRLVVLEHIPRLGNAMVDHATLERLGF